MKNTGFFLTFLWMTYFDCISCGLNSDQNATKIDTIVSGNVTLECRCDSSTGNRWKKLYWPIDPIFVGPNLQEYFPGNPRIISQYSLYIESVDFHHTGTYICVCNFSNRTYQLRVKDVYITINGSRTTKNVLHLEMDKQLTIACNVNGSVSNESVTLMINNQELISDFSNDGEDSLAAAYLTRIVEEGNISCVHISKFSSREWSVSAQFLPYASPYLYITFNGSDNLAKSLSFQENETLRVTCNATGARPAANLTMFINDRAAATSENSIEPQSKFHHTTVTKEVHLSQEHIKITCVANGRYGFKEKLLQVNITTYVPPSLNFTVDGQYVENGTTYHNSGGSLLLFSCYAYGARPPIDIEWKLSGPFEAFSMELESSSEELQVDNISFYTKSTLKLPSVKGKGIVECVTVSSFGIPRHKYWVSVFTKDTSSALTVLIIVCSSSFLAILLMCVLKKKREQSHENVDTSTGKIMVDTEVNEKGEEISAVDSCVKRCHVTLLSKLPGDGTMGYWKAVSSFTSTGGEQIIAKTVSETAPLQELYRFRDTAKDVFALSKHNNIVNTLGVDVENVPFYIYQEYIEHGSLRDYLMRNYQKQRRSQISTSTTIGENEKELHKKLKLTEFALGISDGMSYLATNNLCHPALTSRKILLTKTHTCKIYDFVPERLSRYKVDQVLQQVNAPLAWLPPETIFCQQYSIKADVWSLGVVLWEVYSLGDTPYAGRTNEEIEREVRAGKCLCQPLCCPGGIFSVMLSAWEFAPEKRPSFEQILQQVTRIKNSLKEEYAGENDEAAMDEPSYFTLNDNDYDHITTQDLNDDPQKDE